MNHAHFVLSSLRILGLIGGIAAAPLAAEPPAIAGAHAAVPRAAGDKPKSPPKTEKPKPKTPHELMPKDSVWTGKARDNFRPQEFSTTLTVIESNDEQIKMRGHWGPRNVVVIFVFEVKNNKMTLSRVDKSGGDGGPNRTDCGGPATVTEKNFSLNYSWYEEQQQTKGRVRGTMTLTRDPG